MPKAGGKWSTMEIAAKGRDLSIMFDAKQTSSVRSGVHTEGPIALQFGEGVVKFRKVAITATADAWLAWKKNSARST